MERHLRDIHLLNPLSPSFTSQRMSYKASRFKSHTSPHHRPHYNFHAQQLDVKPIDRSLEFLRKIAEFKWLKEEISSMPRRESYCSFNGVHHSFNRYSPSEANKPFNFPLEPKIENLEVIGYNGYVCGNCLIVHPLRIYKDRYNPVRNPIQTGHYCDMESLLEIQQHKVEKENVLFDLYRNELPLVMFRAIKDWTTNQTRLMAMEVSRIVDGCKLVTVSNLKRWVSRAIRERVTLLTDEELKDFISIVKDRTYAYLKIQNNEMDQNSSKIFFVSIVAGQ
jgi:hypothetical protein